MKGQGDQGGDYTKYMQGQGCDYQKHMSKYTKGQRGDGATDVFMPLQSTALPDAQLAPDPFSKFADLPFNEEALIKGGRHVQSAATPFTETNANVCTIAGSTKSVDGGRGNKTTKPKAGTDYHAKAAQSAAKSSTGTNMNVCTTDEVNTVAKSSTGTNARVWTTDGFTKSIGGGRGEQQGESGPEAPGLGGLGGQGYSGLGEHAALPSRVGEPTAGRQRRRRGGREPPLRRRRR